MAIDVLLTNAFLEENKRLSAISANTSALFDSGFYQNFSSYLNYNICIAPCCVQLWSKIPLLKNTTGEVKVCDTSGYFRCGGCCAWTVPAGVTCAQFQIWGAGAGTVPGCCCGGSPFGGTGAYATVIIPVTAGDSYTLCAGCAYCCYATVGGNNYAPGGSSYVAGTGLTNFCALGGINFLTLNVMDQGCLGGLFVNGYCTLEFFPGTTTLAGPCICNNNTYCFQSCGTCGVIANHRAFAVNYYGTTSSGSAVYGIPGMHGGTYLDSNNYGYHTGAPVIGFDHTPFCGASSVGCCASFTSETCSGGYICSPAISGASSAQPFPGAGGFYTHLMGGGNTFCGDSGRMGMVRVIYK